MYKSARGKETFEHALDEMGAFGANLLLCDTCCFAIFCHAKQTHTPRGRARTRKDSINY